MRLTFNCLKWRIIKESIFNAYLLLYIKTRSRASVFLLSFSLLVNLDVTMPGRTAPARYERANSFRNLILFNQAVESRQNIGFI